MIIKRTVRINRMFRYGFLLSGLMMLSVWLFDCFNLLLHSIYGTLSFHISGSNMFHFELLNWSLYVAVLLIVILPPVLTWLYSSFMFHKRYSGIDWKNSFMYSAKLCIWHVLRNLILCTSCYALFELMQSLSFYPIYVLIAVLVACTWALYIGLLYSDEKL